MKLFSLLILGALSAPPGDGIYPNRDLTPGTMLTSSARIVCRVGYTKEMRDVPLQRRREVFARYGILDHFGDYEVDHFISLELGGSNDIENLWPEPYESVAFTARDKDVVETELHRRVCKGELSLAHAQEIITMDWVAEFKRFKGLAP